MAVRYNYSFKKGCGEVRHKDYRHLNAEIMDLLGCKTTQHYYRKREYFPDIPAHTKEAIEKIFAKYGVTAENVWEITEIDNGSPD